MRVPLDTLFDMENLEAQIAQGFISRKKHPTADLYILNYTPSAQYTPGKMLDHEVRHCRGLIIDGDNNIVARPPAKFHNVSEHIQPTDEEQAERKRQGLPPRLAPPPLPQNETFQVFAKVDGSAGILYKNEGGYAIATRGSFMSEQAAWATRYYQEHYAHMVIPEGVTYFFEVIYSENRIVVHYDFEGLVLLAVIDNATGRDLPLPEDWPGPVVERFDFTDFEAVVAQEKKDPEGSENSEGYVILFESGVRCKVKFAEYCRLHKALTNTSSKTVYERVAVQRLRDTFPVKTVAFAVGIPVEEAEALVANPNPMAELVDRVPDEFADWLRVTILGFDTKVEELRAQVEQAWEDLSLEGVDRKAAAAIISAQENKLIKACLFQKVIGAPYDNALWKAVRPEYVKAFTVDTEG